MKEVPLEYAVSVQGFSPVKVVAMSPGKARAKAWNLYRNAYTETTFKEFLGICNATQPTNAEFEEILVEGQKAWALPGQYLEAANSIAFVYPQTDSVLHSHRLDVKRKEPSHD